jgi:alpha-galactosidase
MSTLCNILQGHDCLIDAKNRHGILATDYQDTQFKLITVSAAGCKRRICVASRTISLSTSTLEYEMRIGDTGIESQRYGLAGQSWLKGTRSAMFGVEINGRRFTSLSPDLRLHGVSVNNGQQGYRHCVMGFRSLEGAVAIDHHIVVYSGTALLECWQTVTNTGSTPLLLTRMDSFVTEIPASVYDLLDFTSAWGNEFEPSRSRLTAARTLETHAGRSSKGQHPWFTLFRDGASGLSASVAWSGNWVFRFEPLAQGGFEISGGLHDWAFAKELQPVQTVESPRVVVVLGTDLDDVSQQYARVGSAYWYPHNALSDAVPVEWNHWWSYEDDAISDAVFRHNVEVAAGLGIEVCTLDAGWFGPSDPGTHWHDYRGDWHVVNSVRFPHGIRPLADWTHEQGLKFGLWCEIEGLGKQAHLAELHPDYVALRDGERLGYVCFGNPAAQEWAYQTLCRLIGDYQCDWIKLDFNLDPGAGCNRTDHGHGAGDGLYEHYIGYYRLLERVRATFPEVVLENCSSGGMRIDLGILRQTHMTFLSDPDWPAHDLQIFWGASTMLAPAACLHWSYSEWCCTNHSEQRFNPRDPNLKPHQLDFYTHVGMLGVYGLSQKLPELPNWVAERLAYHHHIYKAYVRQFVKQGLLFRLTDQPNRGGDGERWCGFQYSMTDGSEHLMFVFRLPGADPKRLLVLKHLDEDRDYTVEWLGLNREEQVTGRELMQRGIEFSGLEEESSVLIWMH